MGNHRPAALGAEEGESGHGHSRGRGHVGENAVGNLRAAAIRSGVHHHRSCAGVSCNVRPGESNDGIHLRHHGEEKENVHVGGSRCRSD